jgi:hypothetical protein
MFNMGEYFYILNLDKKQYLHPHQLGSGLKLWEICASSAPGVLPYLTSQSNDFVEYHKKQDNLILMGTWSGDRIITVGDYDQSGLYGIAEETYENISLKLREEYEKFMGEPLSKRWDE